MGNDINFRKTVKRLKTKLGRVVDAAFVLKRPLGLSDALVLIHGASCSGKSTVLRKLTRRYRGFFALEADRLGYAVREPDETYAQVKEETFQCLLGAGVERQGAKQLIATVDEFAQLGPRHPPYRTMTGLIRACLEHRVVVATCGNLPPPKGGGGFYRELSACTGMRVRHLVMAPDEVNFRKRVETRNLGGRMETLISDHAWRLDSLGDYDLVLDGSEPIAEIVGMIRESIRPMASLAPRSADRS